MSKTDIAGIIGLHLSIKVDAQQMASWPTERITAFFDGLAKAIEAAEGHVESEGER